MKNPFINLQSSFYSNVWIDAASINDACDELSDSLWLRKLPSIVLNIGNHLGIEAASEFSITSLQKHNQTKSMDKKNNNVALCTNSCEKS